MKNEKGKKPLIFQQNYLETRGVTVMKHEKRTSLNHFMNEINAWIF